MDKKLLQALTGLTSVWLSVTPARHSPIHELGRKEKGSRPAQQNVIGLKLAEELKETRTITEAN